MWKARETNPTHKPCKSSSPPWNMAPHKMLAKKESNFLHSVYQTETLPVSY